MGDFGSIRLVNALTDRSEIREARSAGLLAYLDPFKREVGIHPLDIMFLRGYAVSRKNFFEYIAEQFEANDRNIFIPIRLFDGSVIQDAELYAVLSDAEFQEETRFRFHDYPPGLFGATETVLATAKHGGGKKKKGGSHPSYLQEKIAKNMHEWKAGTLKGGAGHHPMVHSQKQALAIAYSQARKHHKK